MGSGELVTSDKPTVFTKPLLDAIVVQDGQSDGRLSDSSSADESDWCKAIDEMDNLLDQFVASKNGPRWWRGGLPGCARLKAYKRLDPATVQITDSVWPLPFSFVIDGSYRLVRRILREKNGIIPCGVPGRFQQGARITR